MGFETYTYHGNIDARARELERARLAAEQGKAAPNANDNTPKTPMNGEKGAATEAAPAVLTPRDAERNDALSRALAALNELGKSLDSGAMNKLPDTPEGREQAEKMRREGLPTKVFIVTEPHALVMRQVGLERTDALSVLSPRKARDAQGMWRVAQYHKDTGELIPFENLSTVPADQRMVRFKIDEGFAPYLMSKESLAAHARVASMLPVEPFTHGATDMQADFLANTRINGAVPPERVVMGDANKEALLNRMATETLSTVMIDGVDATKDLTHAEYDFDFKRMTPADKMRRMLRVRPNAAVEVTFAAKSSPAVTERGKVDAGLSEQRDFLARTRGSDTFELPANYDKPFFLKRVHIN